MPSFMKGLNFINMLYEMFKKIMVMFQYLCEFQVENTTLFLTCVNFQSDWNIQKQRLKYTLHMLYPHLWEIG